MNNKTHYRKLYNPNYIGSWTFVGLNNDATLTIKGVHSEKAFIPGEGESECTVITFEEDKIPNGEKTLPFIVNLTNAKAISKALDTPIIEEWVGKRISLYVAKIRAFGVDMDAIRVRDKAPKSKLVLEPNSDKWELAIENLNQGKITINKIEQYYSLSAENKAKLLENVEL